MSLPRVHPSTLSPAEVAHVYETVGRSVKLTATALGVSPATVRARLRAHHGTQNVPKPALRSSSAAIGAAFERRVRDALTAEGWYVIRAAGSKGTAALVALSRSRIALVNVKRGGSVPVDEWEALRLLAERIDASPVIAFMAHGGRGIEWRRIVGSKDGTRGKRQPWTEWRP